MIKSIKKSVKLFIFAFSFFLFAFTSYGQKSWDTIPNMPQHYVQRMAIFEKEPVVAGKIMFLGNSITEGADWRKLLKDSTVIKFVQFIKGKLLKCRKKIIVANL